MPSFGRKSNQKLDTTHPVIQALCRRVVAHFDITILCGHRPEAEQNAAFASGASTKRFGESRHNLTPSMAVDPAPWPIPEGWGDLKGKTPAARDLDWKERIKFYQMIEVFKFAWSQMCLETPELAERYRLRFGADWDGDNDFRDQTFDDLPHIELWEI